MKKRDWLNLVFCIAVFLGGCTTMGTPITPPPGALEYREVQSEIQRQQVELAITGTTIEADSRDIVEGLTSVETALAVPEYDRDALLNQVRGLRVVAEKHQTDAENLNWQLGRERESNSRLGAIFDEREEMWQKALSERDAENATLKIANAKITGQRNLAFVIAIALAVVIIGYVVIRVLRLLRIIPV
jgi:hypothetical protein